MPYLSTQFEVLNSKACSFVTDAGRVVEHLPGKCEALSSNPSTEKKKF
jgi:hypothetical protein